MTSPILLELGLELVGVDNVSVVGQSQPSGLAFDNQRLGIVDLAGAGGRVPGMPDS